MSFIIKKKIERYIAFQHPLFCEILMSLLPWKILMQLMVKIGKVDIMFYSSRYGIIALPLCFHEQEFLEVFKPEEQDVIMDVGTHIGRYCAISSKKTNFNGKIVAIEPSPYNFKLLLKTLELNKIQNVLPINIAISNYNGTTKLYLGNRTFYNSIIFETKRHITVPCKTLDTLTEELKINRIDWLKIDVEGAEKQVLDGSQKTLKKVKHILLEFHTAKTEILNQLKKHKFKIRFLDADNRFIYAQAS